MLQNLLGITRVRDINEAESQALEIAQELALERYGPDHRFTEKDVRELHRLWLGQIYSWAGRYRSVDIGKGGFQFAHAARIPYLMSELQRGALRRLTPCQRPDVLAVASALAEVHAELILVHPFRDGNGRLARLLALIMGLQAGLPPLDFTPLAGRGKGTYITAIHASMSGNFAPLTHLFVRVIGLSQRRVVSSKR